MPDPPAQYTEAVCLSQQDITWRQPFGATRCTCTFVKDGADACQTLFPGAFCDRFDEDSSTVSCQQALP
jgi:hypothetical protein